MSILVELPGLRLETVLPAQFTTLGWHLYAAWIRPLHLYYLVSCFLWHFFIS